MKKNISLFAFLLLLICILSGCASKPISKTGLYFDTVISITLYNQSDTPLMEECFSLAEKYENLLSKTKENSEVSQINASKGRPVTVSDETAYLLEKALEYARLSQGLVDPSIGSLSNLWDFQSDNPSPPSPTEISNALSSVNYENILLEGNTVTLLDPSIHIDLGFIAKGYIADQMKSYLIDQGVTSGVINLGGNVLTIGSKPDGSPYQIGIQKPFEASGTPAKVLSITDRSVVSSGIYERYFEYEDVLYHHILDTRSGYPVNNDLLAVTILSDSSLEGDALSTLCFSLGFEKGKQLIESLNNVEAIFITTDNAIYEIQ